MKIKKKIKNFQSFLWLLSLLMVIKEIFHIQLIKITTLITKHFYAQEFRGKIFLTLCPLVFINNGLYM